ncbi:hypothetical protein [Aquabacterium sp.]|uniref:hypothetical protein n=1 Tax=Aquabacterium sp. TaxID=1872578 RepID=UPI0035B01150
MPAQSALDALARVRDTSHFSWYVITLLLVVLYTYSREIDKGNWSRVLAALAFWGMDFFNEIWNSLLFHFTQFAPAWSAPGDTAFLIFIGLNIEISFMFAITGIIATMAIPADRNMKILGINNRLFFAVIMSAMSVMVEMGLNHIGALRWEWSWWNRGTPWLIFLLGYLPFYLVCYYVYDTTSRKKQIITVSSILGFDLACMVVFGGWLGWI